MIPHFLFTHLRTFATAATFSGLIATAPAQSTEPVISNVIASQRPGTKLVDISYDLAYTGNQNVEVSVLISGDGGQTFEIPAETLSGAVNRSEAIQPGTGLEIVWNAGVDYNQRYSADAMVRLEAAEWSPPGGNDTNMVTVAGGTLAMSMGTVSVDTFQIRKHEMTWGEWQVVRAEAAERGYDIGSAGAGCADDHPVIVIRWYDVLKWCNLKSEIEGLTPVYTVSGGIYRTGQTEPAQNFAASGYRLPTEAEWEFAARGGNQTHDYDYIYSGSNRLSDVGWHWGISFGAACDMGGERGTWPVGQKNANELGLHDMSGNVREWCWDASGSSRRNRGGSWGDSSVYHYVSYRGASNPIYPSNFIGFRLARSSGN